MLIFYNLFIRLYTLAIRLAAPFHSKAQQWVAGRTNWEEKLEQAMEPFRSRPLLWMHCASLGEFEQGRPVLESIRREWPEAALLLTFFSPSGYEIRKNYELVDHVAYLPADTPANARRFVEITDPALVIFVKYEFWYHHLQAVQQRRVPLLLISAIFHGGQLFFRPGGAPFRRLLRGFDHLFVQNEASAKKLRELSIPQYTIAGDTRIDRVGQIAGQARAFPAVEGFLQGHHCFIAGSTWPPDEERLQPLLNKHFPRNWKCIIAPHQIDEDHLTAIEARLVLPFVRYSQLEPATAADYRVLIIDNIGMLAGLYRYGRIAYIGGGFGAGIHNTLEPAAFALPLLFGPNYHKFEEARQLVARGGAFPVKTAQDILRVFTDLKDNSRYQQASREAQQYIDRNRGATEKIIDYLRNQTELEQAAS